MGCQSQLVRFCPSDLRLLTYGSLADKKGVRWHDQTVPVRVMDRNQSQTVGRTKPVGCRSDRLRSVGPSFPDAAEGKWRAMPEGRQGRRTVADHPKGWCPPLVPVA
jgi:hypothetical protein